jgi:Uma2 family endonuclease
MEPARRRARYEDVIALPEHLVGEIVDGELYASPRPASPHALAASGIGSDLFGRFNRPADGPDAPGGWWILVEPELHLGPDVMVPDLAGWRRERMPRMPDVAYFGLAPDWVCEVVSPRTGILDRRRKMPIYGRESVAHLWIADPILKTLEVYRLETGRWVVASTHGGDDLVRAEPFGAVELEIARWWLDT